MGEGHESGAPGAEGLTIGQLADRTGLTPYRIRAWETRFGFPEPRRTTSGRRSYDSGEVDRVARVLMLQDSGWRLAEAIAHVTREGETEGRERSVYGELRRRLPHLESGRLRRDVLVEVSRAIEDEALARAVRPLVLGTFQRARFYRQSAARWQELARTAEACVVFADFGDRPDPDERPMRVGLPAQSPLLREWVVVVRSIDFSVVLSGWEIPPTSADGDRWYETIVSFESEAVRIAVEACLAAARSVGAPVEAILGEAPEPAVTPPRTPSAGIDAFMLRAFTYLQDGPRP